MWQQGPTQSLQLHQAEAAETEESSHFLSFAKRSREVHRSSMFPARLPARDLHRSSSPPQYGEEFWEKILRYPSRKATHYDPCCEDPFTMSSRGHAEMVWTGVRGVKNENLSVNTLPSPTQLMGRRKNGRGRVQRGDAAQRQAAAVTHHIGELRRKQSAIEQMKKDKWWGLLLGYTSETSCSDDVGTLTSPETLWSSDLSHTHSHNSAPSPTQVFGDWKEMMDLVPGSNPMMSFVITGTAHREAERSWDTPCLDMAYIDTPPVDTLYLDTPCLSQTKFWDFHTII